MDFCDKSGRESSADQLALLRVPLKQSSRNHPSDDAVGAVGADDDYDYSKVWKNPLFLCLMSSFLILFVLVFTLFGLGANPVTETHYEV